MKFKSAAQRKAVMASLQGKGVVSSANVPFAKAPYKESEYKNRKQITLDPNVPLTENDVKLLVKRARDTGVRPEFPGDAIPLSKEQQEKGFAWLKKDALRKDTRLSGREHYIMEQDDAIIELQDIYPHWNRETQTEEFYPLYSVYSKKAEQSFEYYVHGGDMEITG